MSFNAQKNGTVDEFGEYDSFGQGASFYIYIKNRAKFFIYIPSVLS